MVTLLHIPEIETPKLVVREIVEDDWAAFATYMTRPDYQQWIAARLPSAAKVRGFVRGALARQGWPQRKSFHLAAVTKTSGRVIGDGFILLAADRTAEIGWGVAPSRWGRGVGTDIARALVGLSIERLGVNKVWCKVMAPNAASLRVAEKAGLAHRRTFEGHPVGHSETVDVHVMALDAAGYYEAAY
ncbi:MAG: GNAT family N-acetyltransferase [Parvibaculaceae bacterium]